MSEIIERVSEAIAKEHKSMPILYEDDAKAAIGRIIVILKELGEPQAASVLRDQLDL